MRFSIGGLILALFLVVSESYAQDGRLDGDTISSPASALIQRTTSTRSPILIDTRQQAPTAAYLSWDAHADRDTATLLSTFPSRQQLAHMMRGGFPDAYPNANASQAAAPVAIHRPFFCRFDDALDERKIPLRMRIGDLETINRMEQKPGW